MYNLKEVFYTLQGEGFHAGRPAVFARFASCNLWTGREKDRHRAVCRFCDTDFVGSDGGRFDASGLVAHINGLWPDGADNRRMVVLTGGEPLLQVDAPLLDALHAAGFYVAAETNGTIKPPPGIDWLCVSPKEGSEVLVRAGDELKVVIPQAGFAPDTFADYDFAAQRVQPMWVADEVIRRMYQRYAVRWCLENPAWSLSLQTHKWLEIP